MTPETVGKLEEGFLRGFTDSEACLYAGINPSTLYAYCAEHPEFSEKKEVLKNSPLMLAKQIQYDDLLERDKQIAQKVIDRATARKTEISGPQGGDISITIKGV